MDVVYVLRMQSERMQPGAAFVPSLREYTARCEALRADGLPTLPSSIETERRVNPFLRCEEAEVVQSARRHGAGSDTAVEVFATLRQWKNEFR